MSFLCFLIAQAKISDNRSYDTGESGHPCLIPDLKGKALFFFIEDDISVESFIYGFYDL